MTTYGMVTFGAPTARIESIAKATAVVARANPRLPYFRLCEAPKTVRFIPASWGYPDRWFIHWDQFAGAANG